MKLSRHILNLLPAFSIGLFLALEIVSYFFIERTIFDITFVIFGLILFVSQAKYIFTKQLKLFIVFFLFFLIGLYITFVEQNIGSMAPFRLMVHFVFLILLLRYYIPSKTLKIVLYGYMIYVLFLIFVLGVHISAILPAASENFVGWVALALGVGYYSLLYANGEKIESYTAALILVFAVICVGRSTILGAIILLISTYYSKFENLSFSLKYISFSLLLVFFAFMAIDPSILSFISPYFEKFQEKGFDLDMREVIIGGYFDKLNLRTFFLGVTPRQYPFTILHENFHNSYLAAHSQFGVLGFCFLLFLLVVILKNIFRRTYLCLLLLAVCLRITTDTIAFVGLFDFLIFYLISLMMKNKIPIILGKNTKLKKKTLAI